MRLLFVEKERMPLKRDIIQSKIYLLGLNDIFSEKKEEMSSCIVLLKILRKNDKSK